MKHNSAISDIISDSIETAELLLKENKSLIRENDLLLSVLAEINNICKEYSEKQLTTKNYISLISKINSSISKVTK